MCQQLWEAPSPGLVFIWQAHSCTHSIAQGNLSKMISGIFFLTLQLSKKVIQVGLKTGKGKITKLKIKQGKIGQMRYSWENLKKL